MCSISEAPLFELMVKVFKFWVFWPWARERGYCAQREILVSDFQICISLMLIAMREMKSLMILFTVSCCHVFSLCLLVLISLSLCFPHSKVSDSVPASFGSVCLANLVSQSRQCHWRSVWKPNTCTRPNPSGPTVNNLTTTTYNANSCFISVPSLVVLLLVALSVTLLLLKCHGDYTSVLLWTGDLRNIWQWELDCV